MKKKKKKKKKVNWTLKILKSKLDGKTNVKTWRARLKKIKINTFRSKHKTLINLLNIK